MGHGSWWHRSLVWLRRALEAIVGRRWSSIRWNIPIWRFDIATIAVGPWALYRVDISVRCGVSIRCSRICRSPFLVKLIIFLALVASSPHANIATNSYTTTLLRDNPAQRRACSQPRELLSAVHGERYRLDLEAEMKVCLRRAGIRVSIDLVGQRQCRVLISILGVLNLFVKVEVQTVPSLMAHR